MRSCEMFPCVARFFRTRFAALCLAGLSLALCGLEVEATENAPDTIELREGLVLGRVSRYGRAVLNRRPVSNSRGDRCML